MAYGMGAVAPLMYTGAVLSANIPERLDQPFMSLPYHLYILVTDGISLEYAYGTAFVLLLLLLIIHLFVRGVGLFREGGQWRWRRK
jgi:phosphate transport system permease protein